MLSHSQLAKVRRFESQYGKSEGDFSPDWHANNGGPEQTFSPSWHADQLQVTTNLDEARAETAEAVKSSVDPQV
jgi:hypothetical protein